MNTTNKRKQFELWKERDSKIYDYYNGVCKRELGRSLNRLTEDELEYICWKVSSVLMYYDDTYMYIFDKTMNNNNTIDNHTTIELFKHYEKEINKMEEELI